MTQSEHGPDDRSVDLPDDMPGDVPGDLPERGALDLAAATAQLRERPTDLPVAVADRVLERALATPRPAELVRAGGDDAHLRVSTVALVGLVRDRLDRTLVDAAVRRIRCWTTRDERLDAVAVDLVARYGVDLREVAETTHDLVADVLGAALGASHARTHVHVSDVTRGDPRLVEPRDEV